MLNMETTQMYDTVQSLSQLDLKKQPQQAVIGQITLTAMSSAQQQHQQQSNTNTNDNNNGTDSNMNNNNNNVGSLTAAATVVAQQQNVGLVVKQHAVHQMQQAAAALNNNNSTSTINANVNNVNNLLQKQMLQQYSQSDLDEFTAQEITLDLQHLIDDQFREQDNLGIFNDMVTSPGGLSATLPPSGMVSAAAKVFHQHQLQQQSLRTQQQNYGRSALAYMPQAVHSGAAYSNNSSDENSSIGSDTSTSTIKEEPIDPEYRRHLQDTNANNTAATAFITNGSANGLYNPYQTVANNVQVNNGGMGNAAGGTANNFTTLTSASVLAHHSVNLPHLTAGAHLLKHHNKQLHNQRKSSLKNVDKGSDEYRRRRERNNIAVRKSREKAKVRSREVEERVKTLLKEKEALLRQLQEMNNEIQLHKQIYMQLMNHANPEVSRVCRSFLNTNDHGL